MRSAMVMSDPEKLIVSRLGGDLPDCKEPFRALAEELGLPEHGLIEKLLAWKEDGTVRRFGAIVRHRAAGYEGNAMVVWQVPEERLQEVGGMIASHPEVSHCYERPAREGWPYNLYTMVHARDRDECLALVREIALEAGIQNYQLLFTRKELKKASMVYFVQS